MLYPFLPFSSQKLHEYLGLKVKSKIPNGKFAFPNPGKNWLNRKLFLRSSMMDD